MRSLFEEYGCQPVRTVIADQEDALASLVRNGVGLAILRRDKIERLGSDGTMVALPRRLPPVQLRFAVLTRRAHEPMLGAVIEEVARVWKLEIPDGTSSTQPPHRNGRGALERSHLAHAPIGSRTTPADLGRSRQE